MNHSDPISPQDLSQPHKFSKQLPRFNNLDPRYFTKTHPKIIQNLGISQLALQHISPQNLKKLTQSLKSIKFLHSLKLRLGKCNPEDLKKVIKQLKALKGIQSLKLDLFGFQRDFLCDLMTFPRKIARGRNLKELNVDFSRSDVPPNLMFRLLSGFLASHSSLTSLHSKFEALDMFQEKDLALLSKSLQKRASLLKDLNLDFNECYSVSGKGLYVLMTQGFSSLPDLKKLSLNLRDCCPTDSEDFGINLLKTQDLVCLDLNFLRFQGISTKYFEFLAIQFRDWSLSFKSLAVRLPSIEAKDFDVFTNDLGELKSLRNLKLTINTQGNESQKMIQSLIKGLEKLEALEDLRLKFKDMKLQNKDVEMLFEKIKEKTSLKYLKLSLARNNEITKKGLDEVFYSLKELKNLEGLDLNLKGCKVNSSSINKLAVKIETLKELRTFKLCLNNLEGDGILKPLFARDKGSDLNCLLKSLSNLPKLLTLKLKLFHIEMTGKNLMDIAQNLKKIPSLKKLTFYFCCDAMDLTAWRTGYEILFYGLKEILTLTDLSINIDRTDNNDLEALFKQLNGWSHLRSLFLGLYRGDIIDEESAEEFYKAMRTLGGLKNFAMYFYWGAHIQAGAALQLLKGVGELNCIENLEFDLVNTTIGYLARDPDYPLGEVESKLLEKFVNMKSLKKFYYMDDQIV